MSQHEFRLPDVGEGLSEGEIVEWHVEPGSTVKRDQVLVDVETDKSIVELPSPVNGTVVRLGAAVGDVLEVGAVLVVLETDERSPVSAHGAPTAPVPTAPVPTAPVPTAPAAAAPAAAAPAAAAPAVPAPPPPAEAPPAAASGGRVLASPATRKLALELGVDLSAVAGSGDGGRVTKDDVLAHSSASAADEVTSPSEPAPSAVSGGRAARAAVPPLKDELVPLRGLRRSIAKSMTKSWTEVPHITEFREVDATALVAARKLLRPRMERDGVAFTYLPLLVKAVVATLREHPKFNASVDMSAETIQYHGRRNIGLATTTDAGLIVPVLKDADTLTLSEIAREIEVLANAARDRSVSTDQTAQGTFTITNFGTFGGWIATPIIRPPEAAIAGFGRIRETVVAVDGQPVVRPTLPLSVSADHRLIDGNDMGGFLTMLIDYLTDPVLMLEAS